MSFKALMIRAFEEASETESVEVTMDQIRAYFDGGDLPEDIETVLDYAQGQINQGVSETYVLIKVTK